MEELSNMDTKIFGDPYKIDFKSAVSRDDIPGCRWILVSGRNANSTTSDSTIWPEANLYSFPSAATAMTVSSTSAADTIAGGTGAGVVQLVGLDSDYNQVTHLIQLNGTTGVAIPTNLLRVNDLTVVFSGSGGVNAGDLYVGSGTVSGGKPATVYRTVMAGLGISSDAVYTVPAGKVVIFKRIIYISSSDKITNFSIALGFFGTNTTFKFEDIGITNASFQLDASHVGHLPARTDLTFRALVDTADTTNAVQCYALETDA